MMGKLKYLKMLKVFFSFVLILGLYTSAIADQYDDGLQAFEKGDHEAALRLLEPSATTGDLVAQLTKFQIYMDETSEFSDPEKGLAWLLAKAENGSPSFQYLAGLYEKNPENKMKWFTLAADQGYEDAQIEVKRINSEIEKTSKKASQFDVAFALISFCLGVFLLLILVLKNNILNKFFKKNGTLAGMAFGAIETATFFGFYETLLITEFISLKSNYFIEFGLLAILIIFFLTKAGHTLTISLFSISTTRVPTLIFLSFGATIYFYNLNIFLDEYVFRSYFWQHTFLKFIPFMLLFFIFWKVLSEVASIMVDDEQFNAGLRAANREDFEAAYFRFKPLAEKGDVEAQLFVAEALTLGLGVEKNHLKALKFLRNAEKKGQVDAYFLLGVIYGFGEILPKDITEAKKWYELGATSGNKYCQFNLGCLLIGDDDVVSDYEAAMELFLSLVDDEDLDVHLNLGICYLNADKPLQNYPAARKHLKRAAECTQDPSAQIILGGIYYEGLGTPVDYEQAFKWTLLASDQQVPLANALLGLMYLAGDGVPVDHEEAHRLLRLAVEHDEELGKEGLALLTESGFPDEYEKALQLQLQKHRKEYQGEANKSVSPETNIITFPGPRKLIGTKLNKK